MPGFQSFASRFLFMGLLALASLESYAGAPNYFEGKVVQVHVAPNYSGSSEVVDGVKVYKEGTPQLVVVMVGDSPHYFTLSLPFGSDKARAMMELAKSSLMTEKEIGVYYAGDFKNRRTACAVYDAKGCIEMGAPTSDPTLVQLILLR